MGYSEVLKLCQEALAVLTEDAPLQDVSVTPGSTRTDRPEGQVDLDGAPSVAQPINVFMSETDQLISEISTLLRRYETMRDIEDMSVETLANEIRAFTSSVQQELNRG